MKPTPPPEWAKHKAVWIGFPSHPDLWESLGAARAEVAAFARAVHADGAGEKVLLVAADEEAAAAAWLLAGDVAQVVVTPFGDIWLRDTGVILDAAGTGHAFEFNGWGGKYEYDGDTEVGVALADRRGIAVEPHGWVLEGGSLDWDGTGLVVTTEQCLLNRNRNPGLSVAEAERRLRDDLGFDRVLWLGNGLANDHTDGHIDNLARFVGPNRLAIPVAEENDPNWMVYQDARRRAEAFGVEVVPIPSPGRVIHGDEVVPASYMNFYIGNAAVVVPIYGQPNDRKAVEAIGALFPGREAVGLRADHILTGGGSFHCISQQIPA